jgi:hypothetical protein
MGGYLVIDSPSETFLIGPKFLFAYLLLTLAYLKQS